MTTVFWVLGLDCSQTDLEGTVTVMRVETEQATELTPWGSLSTTISYDL